MVWGPEKAVRELPDYIQAAFTDEASALYNELRHNRLTVILIPAPRPMHSGHMIRAVESENPSWYRDLYHSVAHFRRDRSMAALDRIRKGQDGEMGSVRPFRDSFRYDFLYRDVIMQRLVVGYAVEEHTVKPDPKIKRFFRQSSQPHKSPDLEFRLRTQRVH